MFTFISFSDEDELNRSKHSSGHAESMRLKRDGNIALYVLEIVKIKNVPQCEFNLNGHYCSEVTHVLEVKGY